MAYRVLDPSMAHLAELLGKHFTVYNYDRRGRGDSGDTQPFAREREIEDLQALVEDAGGKAMVFRSFGEQKACVPVPFLLEKASRACIASHKSLHVHSMMRWTRSERASGAIFSKS